MTCIPSAPPMSHFHFTMWCGSSENGAKLRVPDATKAMITRLLALFIIFFFPGDLHLTKVKA